MAKLNTENEQQRTSGDLRDSNTMMMLLGYVERFERLQEEKEALAADQREVMDEAKGVGFDTKTLRKVIQRRKMDTADRIEADSILETYEEAIRQAMKKQTADSEAEAQ